MPGDRPDPTVVIKIGNTYWASATSNEWSPLFPIFKSDDLLNWESAEKGAVKVWQTIEGETKTFSNAELAQEGELVELRMEVSDGNKITFSWRNGENWNQLTESREVAYLVPWEMGDRLGLVAKAPPSQAVNFKHVALNNY